MQPAEGSETRRGDTAGGRGEPLPPLVSTALDSGHGTLEERLGRLAAQGDVARRYTVLGELARGGMGKIVRAWDAGLAREVAMKTVPREAAEGSSDDEKADHERRLLRFIDEARITGQLDHPGIVPVHEIGLDVRGDVFFTMPLVRGQTLKSVFLHLRRHEGGWTLERVIDVMHTVCLTVAFAHSRGVVHRDLKPENIMVGPYGEALVMDWGLALLVGRGEGGGIVGTPAYMSPEQAAGRTDEVGPRSDVYSLGAILYELLGGRMPHAASLEGEGDDRAFDQIIAAPPRPLAELRSRAPRELVAICDKAMARDPEERYASALEMAADLEAWRSGRVVSAVHAGPVERLMKWRARNRSLALALDALVALGMIAGAALFVQQRSWLGEVRAKHRQSQVSAYAAGLMAADLGLRVNEVSASKRRLEACEPSLRGWEWRHLALRADASVRVLVGHDEAVRDVAVAPDGRRVASASDDGTVRVWSVLDAAVTRTLEGHRDVVTAVRFSPDGRRIVSASFDDDLRVWDAETGALERRIDAHADDVVACALSSDGARVVSADDSGRLLLTSLADGERLAEHRPAAKDIPTRLEYLPPDGPLVVSYVSGHLRLFEPRTLKLLSESRIERGSIVALDVTSDGSRLAAAIGRTALVLDSTTLDVVHAISGHGSKVNGVAFSPDGRLLATCGYDNVVRVWDAVTGEASHEFHGHDSDVNSVAFFPGGRVLATASEDGTLRLWDLRREPISEFLKDEGWVTALAFSPDGRELVSGTRDQALRRHEVASGLRLAQADAGGIVDCLAWSPEGAIVFGCGESAPRAATPEDLAASATLGRGDGYPRNLCLSPDGRRVFSRSSDGDVHVYDLVGHERLAVIEVDGDESAALALSHDGHLLAAGTKDGQVRLWNARTYEPLGAWDTGRAPITALAFAPDGARLAVGLQTCAIAVLSCEDGSLERTLAGHENFVSSLAFSPDGTRLASGAYDHTVRIWDPEDSEALLTLHGHTEPVTAVAFDAAGEVLASSSKDGSLRVWRTARAFDAGPGAPAIDDGE